MGTILEDVFLGTAEKYNQKLEMLARMAQPEKWTYKRIQDKDPYRILRNYIQYTYNRLDEEGKIISSADGKYRCMNTGLLTVYNQEIVAVISQWRKLRKVRCKKLIRLLKKAKEYYEGVTVLPVEWAYMNSRLIVKPDEEWAKIMDEITSADEAESIREAVDMAE